MDIFNHPRCTHVMGKPSNMTDAQCAGLPVLPFTDELGTSAMSFWKPSAEDLAILNAGGTVALGILGGMQAHPVVFVTVGHPVEEAKYIGAPVELAEKPFELVKP